ncbi:MAG TPA: glucosamine-6-phosphate isomerase [Verrucomicrobiae bacterium]|nr:glucosamine-6-phosphate isomerase [Verrucomicrobiae bacterium]
MKVRIVRDAAALAEDFARAILSEIEIAKQAARAATFIVPVGPVDQYPVLAQLINSRKIFCRDVVFINMDEYLDEHDQLVSEEHPLGFRGHMNRSFYGLLESALAPVPKNRIFPDPNDPGAIQKFIQARGGVDVCFGGIGINGHIAFNEPPEPGEQTSAKTFAGLSTRIVTLARETRTINSVTVGGEISIVPPRAVTIGMKEILAARRLRFYCNRPWQSAVVRRVLHGPLTPACPASFLRTHPDAMLTMTEQVATPPQIQLR